MTLQDLIDEVSRLGFETQPEEEWEDSLYAAVNHALREIRRVIPKYSSIQIINTPQKAKTVVTDSVIGADTYTLYCADCGAILIEISGKADIVLKNESGTVYHGVIECNKPYTKQYTFKIDDYILPGANRDITAEFTSEAGAVLSAAMYGYPVDTADMHFAKDGMIRYDLADEYSDLYQIEYIKYNGEKVIDYIIDGKKSLLIPEDCCGRFEVVYRCKVPKIEVAAVDTVIPLEDEECDLLTLLTASYVLLDEGDGKSSYYMQLYQQELANLLRSRKPQKEKRIRDFYGW